MSDDDKPMIVMILGRTIGTAGGWDGDEQTLVFYNFIPVASIDKSITGTLQVEMEKGILSVLDDDGIETTQQHDLIDFFRQFPRDEPLE